MVLTIPIAIISAVTALYLFGQTINIMTLSGLALSIGMLVDEATVTIENIHQHVESGKPKQRAIVDALLEISIPKLLILLCILAVLTPAFIMTGIPRDMFMPPSMAVAFAMVASFLASQTFVPILANRMMKFRHNKAADVRKKRVFFEKFRISYSYRMRKWFAKSALLFIVYVVVAGGIAAALLTVVGTDVMPVSNNGDFQVRIQAREGSRLEKTEQLVRDITEDIRAEVPENGISITSAFVGTHPAGELQGGDYAQVRLKLQRKSPSYWVPGKSVLKTQPGTFVMTLGDDEIRRVPVKEGIRLDTLTEVFGDLSADSRVILKPSEEIREGQLEKH